MMGLDPVTITTGVVTGLGILAAGIGIYKFGSQHGATQAKTTQAMDMLITTMPRAVAEMGRQREALERNAKAAEENAKWIPLIEQMHEERHELGLTLRSMARKLNALMRTNEDSNDDQGS